VIGRVISHYRIVGSLGAGGMGVIYRAEDDRLGRAVALKFLPQELAHDSLAVDRLRAEARAASALNHSNICTVYDIGEDEGQPFIVMELLTGSNLRELLAAGPLKIQHLVEIGIQIADALDAAHSHGIIHRDIKPANIFVTERHQAKLLDFGVAKLTETFGSSGATASTKGMFDLTAPGSTLGTAAYMSPEQATGEALDGRTDLFSLGVVLYEAATSHHPFAGKTSAVVLSAILNRAPVAPIVLNPDLPPHLQEIINNCLEKDRELRYQSAADLRADLKRLRRDLETGYTRPIEAVSATTPMAARTAYAPAERSSPPVGSAGGRAWWAASLLLVALLAGLGSYLMWLRSQPDAPAAASDTLSDALRRIDEAASEITARLAEQPREETPQGGSSATEAAPAAAPPPAPAAAPAAPPPSARPAVTEASPAPNRAATSQPAPAAPARVVPPPGPSSASTAETPSNVAKTAPPRPDPSSGPPNSPAEASPPSAPAAPASPPQESAAAPAQRVDPAPTPVPSVTRPPAEPPSAPPSASPAPVVTPGPVDRRELPPANGPSAAEDEASIRQVVATYARAIETKDIALFRSVKPNLSREEQRRIEEGFRAVTRQTVDLTVLSIERKGQQAVVAIRRRDTIQAGGREQTVESRQTLTMVRAGEDWTISEIR
jgi:predicted Ser/Thr protein kinase